MVYHTLVDLMIKILQSINATTYQQGTIVVFTFSLSHTPLYTPSLPQPKQQLQHTILLLLYSSCRRSTTSENLTSSARCSPFFGRGFNLTSMGSFEFASLLVVSQQQIHCRILWRCWHWEDGRNDAVYVAIVGNTRVQQCQKAGGGSTRMG